MGAGLYPPPINISAPRGIVKYQALGSSSYVGSTETRAYVTTWQPEQSRLYRITFTMASIDTDGVGDNANTAIRYAKNSAVIRARWQYGTNPTTADADLGYRLATVFDDDSMTSSGVTCSWHIGGATAGVDLSVGVFIYAYRAHTTYGMVRCLSGGGGSSVLQVEDIGPWPPPA